VITIYIPLTAHCGVTRPHSHKTFEYSQENSQIKYVGAENIFSLENDLRLKYVQAGDITDSDTSI
jgi:hypothetical protein